MRIINVANRLPVTVAKTIRKSSGGLVAALDGVRDRMDMLLVGWPGCPCPKGDRGTALRDSLEKDYGCIPVFLSQRDIKTYYHGFSNRSLWPLLHYMTLYVRHDEVWWESYRRVNELFAETILEAASPGDLIWVHDYHLMLLPALLRARAPEMRVGFFLHTPFPSYEVFRCHPHRAELLRGVLGSDLVGFHTYGYMRHFRSSAMRILGYDAEINQIRQEDRHTQLGVFPIGINAPAFSAEMESRAYARRHTTLAAAHHNRRLILSVERLDYTKGIARRLMAIDRFLDKYPDMRDEVSFLFVAVPSREEVPEYQELRESVESMVGRINGKHATVENTPIHFLHNSIPFTDLCALYALADVALVTPLIDGMNLVAKEYIACQKEEEGVLILSEFAGAANELFDALTVNPFDIDDVADRIREALDMPAVERRRRMQAMRRRVVKFDARRWAGDFIHALEKTDPVTARASVESLMPKMVEAVSAAGRILCFLDYDGTLREFETIPGHATPTREILALVERMNRDPGMEVFIISGRTRTDLGNWLGGKGVGLVAEHGLVWRGPEEVEWQPLVEGLDLSWKEPVMEIFRAYADSTPGVRVEEKPTSIVWHYRRADPEYGLWKAQQLVSEMREIMTNHPVEIGHGQKIVEVGSMHVSKGAALRTLTAKRDYDLLLCVGDDVTDESMFRVEDERMYSIKIGSAPTLATFRLKTPHALRLFMERLLDTRAERTSTGG